MMRYVNHQGNYSKFTFSYILTQQYVCFTTVPLISFTVMIQAGGGQVLLLRRRGWDHIVRCGRGENREAHLQQCRASRTGYDKSDAIFSHRKQWNEYRCTEFNLLLSLCYCNEKIWKSIVVKLNSKLNYFTIAVNR